MSKYDYEESKKRIGEILSSDLNVIYNDKLPKLDKLTFENSYYSNITSIFIDIRNSTYIFENFNKTDVSKIMKCYISEVIEILRDDDNCREIGIRGDCVYGIYTTPNPTDIFSILIKACEVEKLILIENKLFNKHNINIKLNVGIGIASSKVLVIKAGRKYIGINNKIWIGDAVVKASNLCSYALKYTFKPICISEKCYNILIEKNFIERNRFIKCLHNNDIFYSLNNIKE